MTTSPAGGTVPQWTVGDRLRKAREMAGLDGRDFAKELGISRNSVTKYEHGDTPPRSVVLLAWSMRTGVAVDWLRSGTLPFGGPLNSETGDPGRPVSSGWTRRRKIITFTPATLRPVTHAA